MRSRLLSRFVVTTSVLAALLVSADAAASKLKILYAFGAQERNGSGPEGALLLNSGNVFGTTSSGGGKRNAQGTVWELVGAKKFKLLHKFLGDSSGGARPFGNLIMDVNGNLYGTTAQGGTHDGGTAFELSPNGDGTWTFQVLYNFCAEQNCADGTAPPGFTYMGASSGALYDGISPLYGVSSKAALDLMPSEQGWSVNILYRFCSQGGDKCTDGNAPTGVPFLNAAGQLFGTTFSGGANGKGTVFELDQNGGTWTETVLYSFCSQKNCIDGDEPEGSVLQDAAGNLYGSTMFGGVPCKNAALSGSRCGVLFEVVPNGLNSQETVLYQFCSKKDCKDGAFPGTALIMDATGNLFGTTVYGGGHDQDIESKGGGTVFKFGAGSLSVLHAFCAEANCADGEDPLAPVTLDGSGNLVGSTGDGGPNGGGEVFRLTP